MIMFKLSIHVPRRVVSLAEEPLRNKHTTRPRELHAKTREFHARTRELHAKTREFHARTRELHAKTREFHARTREDRVVNSAIANVRPSFMYTYVRELHCVQGVA